MKENFEIVISSDIDYDDLCAEIYYKDQIVAMLSQENGVDNMIIDIYSSKNECWKFNLNDFDKIVLKAKKMLLEMK
jgi:hypothetical protein